MRSLRLLMLATLLICQKSFPVVFWRFAAQHLRIVPLRPALTCENHKSWTSDALTIFVVLRFEGGARRQRVRQISMSTDKSGSR